MLKKQLVVAAVLVTIALPVGADTVTGSATPNTQKLWTFVAPMGGGQALITASWKQKGNTALVLLVCQQGAEMLQFGVSANLNANRTARIEAGVLGDMCVVGIAGFGGKVTFRLNVQVSFPEGLTKQSRAMSAGALLVPVALSRFPAVVEELNRLQNLLASRPV